MIDPENSGISFEFQDHEVLVEAMQRGLIGQIGHIALQKPLKGVTIAVKNAGNNFDLEATVALDHMYFYPFDSRRREEAAEFIEVFLAEHQGSNDRQRSEAIPEVVRSIGKLYEESAKRGGNYERDLDEEFLEATDDLTDVQERGGRYTFIAPSGRRLAIQDKGLRGITITTGQAAKDIFDIEMGDETPTRVIHEQPITTDEEFQAYFGDVAYTVNALLAFLYGKHDKPVPSDVMPILRAPKLSRDEKMMLDLKSSDDKIKGLEVENPNISFEDIGGLGEAKQEVEALAFALKNPKLYRKWGTDLPKGVLIYGPPGTGKTLLAKALASEGSAQFLNINLTDIMSMWLGESEKLVDEIFDYAEKQEGNVIIFLDEVDAIAPRRDGVNTHEASKRIVSTILTRMDGIKTSANNVLTVATSNRKDAIDEAFRSRLDTEVEAPLPDEQGRENILRIHFDKASTAAKQAICGEIDYAELARSTSEMSGRKLSQVVRKTIEAKIRLEGLGEKPGLITTEDVLAIIKAAKTGQQSGATPFGFGR